MFALSSLASVALAPLKYGIESAASEGVYQLSKNFSYGSTSLVIFVSDNLAHLPEYLLNSVLENCTGNNPQFNLYSSTIKPVIESYQPFSYINEIATNTLIPGAYKVAEENAKAGFNSFVASDLILPAIVLTASSKYCLKNLSAAGTKFKYLATGVRSITTEYEIPKGKLSNLSVEVLSQDNYSAGKLFLGALGHLTCASAWGLLGYYTRQGMLTALTQAGVTEGTTANVVNAIAATSVALPIIIHAANKLLSSRPPIAKENAQPEALNELEDADEVIEVEDDTFAQKFYEWEPDSPEGSI